MVSIFGTKKRNFLSEALNTSWKNDEERVEVLKGLRETKLTAKDATALIFSRDAGVRGIGVDAFIERAEEKSIGNLIRDMQGKPPAIRGFVNRLFSRLPPELMKKSVDTMLIHKDPSQRHIGWEVALELSDEIRNEYLLRALNEAPLAVRSQALQRLIQSNKPEDIQKPLIEAAESPNPQLAAPALDALQEVESEEVAELMLRVFGGSDARARGIATAYMRRVASRRPREMQDKLLTLLGGGEDATRRECVELLLLTGEPREILIKILDFSRELMGWLRNRILETLQTFGDTILTNALELLDHPDEQIRTGALVLAEGFKDERLVAPLCELLKGDDWWLRLIACEALGKLGSEQAVPHLISALDDSDTRWSAIDALANIGSSEAVKPLSALLKEPRIEVRREVIRAFGKFTDPNVLHLLRDVQEQDESAEIRTLSAEVYRGMAGRLNMTAEAAGSLSALTASQLESPLDKLLAQVREEGASDLHVTVGEPPFVRKNGVLERMEGQPEMSLEEARDAVLSTLTERQIAKLRRNGEVDYCYSIPEVGRYRANAFQQRNGLCAAFRVIPNLPPTFASIRLPGHLTELLDYHQGLIVVSGPAGSGKSTTLSAIINLINETKAVHVLTLEDPIEFVHPIKTGLVNQREVNGLHSESFARALRGALREDPDIIVVGQLKDAETMAMALEAAETGHLVIATMNTTSAIQTVDRLVGAFPPEEQPAIRMALSDALKYVVSQSLVVRKDNSGRVAVFEILKGTSSIQNLIRDNKSFQIGGMMQVGRRFGMQTVDMALMDLFDADIISAETAWMRAEKPEVFEPYCDPEFLQGISRDDSEESDEEAAQ